MTGRTEPIFPLLGGLLIVAIAAKVAPSFEVAVIGAPALGALAWAASRWPVAFVLGALLLIGFPNTGEGLLGTSTVKLGDALLLSLALGVIARATFGMRSGRATIPPAVALLGLFAALTAAQVFGAETVSLGGDAFRANVWPAIGSAIAVLAIRDREEGRHMLDGLVIVCLAVCGYAVYRYLFGQSTDDVNRALASPLNNIKVGEKIGLVGSFFTRGDLAIFAELSLPLCVARALLADSPRSRAIAAVAGLITATAIIAVDVRTAVIAGAIGVIVVLALQQLTSVGAGSRLGVTLGATLLIVAGSATAFALGGGSDAESKSRLSEIFTPSHAATYQQRLSSWPRAIRLIQAHPTGIGLGTTALVAKSNRSTTVDAQGIDNGYLQIAVEQGIPALLLFVFGMLTALGTTIRRAILTLDTAEAAACVGAAGSICALLVAMYVGYLLPVRSTLVLWLALALALRFSGLPATRPEPYLAAIRARAQARRRRLHPRRMTQPSTS